MNNTEIEVLRRKPMTDLDELETMALKMLQRAERLKGYFRRERV